jgi:shikimate dehydrogenase
MTDEVGGTSRVAAVIGDPVRHSRSPQIHNAAFAATGLDWKFMAFEVPPGDAVAALDAMRVLRLGGLSVTMPHKAAVAQAADEVSDAVATLDAANCVVPLADGRLRAENTDVIGFLGGLTDDAGITPRDRKVVVLGAGGAARAVIHACHGAGAADIAVVNRSADRAMIAAELAAPTARVGTIADIAGADLVVNATSVGLNEDEGMPCAVELIESKQVVVDLIYSPLRTRWVAELRSRGIEAHNGLSMLVHQAAAAFELWTGVPAPIDVMREAALGPAPA